MYAASCPSESKDAAGITHRLSETPLCVLRVHFLRVLCVLLYKRTGTPCAASSRFNAHESVTPK